MAQNYKNNKLRKVLKQGTLDFLPEILVALEETKAIEYTKKIAAQEIDSALSYLMILPDSKYKDALINWLSSHCKEAIKFLAFKCSVV